MHLKKVLTPELVLGLRGEKARLKLYETALKEITSIGGKQGGILATPEFLTLDPITQGHLALAFKFKNENKKQVYHVGHDFLTGISTIRKDFPFEFLPERFLAYFSFAENTFQESSVSGHRQNVRGGFVGILPWAETSISPSLVTDEKMKVLWISYDMEPVKELEEKAKEPLLFTAMILMPLLEKNIHEVLEGQDTMPDAVQITDYTVFRTLLNLALYIHSSDPDLLPLKTTSNLSIRERKALHNKTGATNHCLIPVTLVSWNYKTPKTFHVDSTLVASHFRWQRYGENFSKVKLILIGEHERHFK